MAIVSNSNIQIEFSGNVSSQFIQSALENESASGESNIFTLATGDNVISPPVVSGIIITGVMIVPPSGNTIVLTLKGDVADVGIPLHLTNPTFLAVDTTFIGLIINVASDVIGVIFIWT